METPNEKKILKKGTPFTIIRNSGTQEAIAKKEVQIRIVQKKLGFTYFKLGEMMCRTTCALMLLFLTGGGETPGFTQEEINVQKLANAIYYAEGGSKTKHPYGILSQYWHTTSRKACLNTIEHRLRLWNGEGNFIVYLSKTYCPIGANNDPNNLNINWVRNVEWFYER